MIVDWNELTLAHEFVSTNGGGDAEAFLRRESGMIYWRSIDIEDFEELPDDLDDEEKYLAIPGKRQLDLGKQLVLDFARERLPDLYDDIRDIFRRKGAYGRFKGLLERRGALEDWHAFEAKAQEQALKEWCEENGIEIKGE
ncbi:hypothetical protein A8B73_06395 [Methylosinus sp. 3S-1]|nr:hypothetical protein A8B73_06395 [Methylosinus sp. 3S-1]